MARSSEQGLRGRLVERFGRWGEAGYTFAACLLALALSGLAAHFARNPLIFPSLGPTAYLVFEAPMSAQSSPRNTLIGHLIAILSGVFSLAVFGLLDDPSAFQEGVTFARVGAAALSLALTGAAMPLLRASHPPAGATVLIVSLGLLQTLPELASLAAGVVILTAAGWAINRVAGVPVPLWSPRE